MATVKCPVCGKEFDKTRVKCVQYSARRYAHFSCASDKPIYVSPQKELSQEELDKKALCDYIVERHGLKATGPTINRQIKQYHDEAGYTYTGMLKALQYWYDVKHNYDPKFRGTIAIIGNVYDQAYDYYYNLYKAQFINRGKQVQDYQGETKEVTIPSPRPRHVVKRLFDLDYEEED